MEVDIKSLSCESVCSYVRKQIPTVSDSIFKKIREHKVDGEVFLSLNDECLCEIAPLLRDRLKVITVALSNAATVSFVEIFFHALVHFLLLYSFLILRLRAYQRRWFQHLVPPKQVNPARHKVKVSNDDSADRYAM